MSATHSTPRHFPNQVDEIMRSVTRAQAEYAMKQRSAAAAVVAPENERRPKWLAVASSILAIGIAIVFCLGMLHCLT